MLPWVAFGIRWSSGNGIKPKLIRRVRSSTLPVTNVGRKVRIRGAFVSQPSIHHSCASSLPSPPWFPRPNRSVVGPAAGHGRKHLCRHEEISGGGDGSKSQPAPARWATTPHPLWSNSPRQSRHPGSLCGARSSPGSLPGICMRSRKWRRRGRFRGGDGSAALLRVETLP